MQKKKTNQKETLQLASTCSLHSRFPGLILVSIHCLLRLPNGDESDRRVGDFTALRHKSGMLVHQWRLSQWDFKASNCR